MPGATFQQRNDYTIAIILSSSKSYKVFYFDIRCLYSDVPSNNDILEALILSSATSTGADLELSIKKKQHPLHTRQLTLFDGVYDLTTKSGRVVMGRNTQLDEGAGRQIWKCPDPLNCIALDASCIALHIV